MSTYNSDVIIKMWQGATAQLKANHEYFSQLDSILGDGDHGTSMLRIAQVVDDTIAANAGKNTKDMLAEISEAVLMADAGSSSPLLGSFFQGMSDTVNGDELTAAEVVAVFAAGLDEMQAVGKAKPGDKTSLDTWLPGMAKMTEVAADGDLKAAAVAAVAAAEAGAEATKGMVARCGRARNYGEKSVGYVDAGAVSASYMFKGFAEVL